MLGIFSTTSHFAYIEQNFTRPIDYWARERLKKGPTLDPRIKIFAIDDITVAWLKSEKLSLPEWATLLAGFEKLKPKAIFIEKFFGFETDRGLSAIEMVQAQSRLLSLKVPVIAGAYVAPKRLPLRKPIDLKAPDFSLSSMTNFGLDSEQGARDLLRVVLPRSKTNYVYGPYPAIRNAFRHIGHNLYDGDGRVSPFLRINRTTILPHMALYAAGDRKFLDGYLHLDDKKVPMTSDGRVNVNFASYPTYRKASMSLKNNLERAQKGQKLIGVGENDYVFILPLHFTGLTEFKSTPLGSIPVGFVSISILNSVLQNNWLKPVDAHFLIILLACLVGGGLMASLGPFLSTLSGIFVAGAWVAFSVYLFSHYSLVLPWSLGLVGFFGTGFSVSMMKSINSEKRERSLRSALDGAVSPQHLEKIVRNSEEVNLNAKEQVLTIVFIDVVGYSLLAENQVPRVAFDQLKELLGQLSEEVHKSGGIVNKTLGDGLLCLFGYNFDDQPAALDHAEKALACAIRIQEKNLARNLKAFAQGEKVYPLRIGIHTASVFVGDLGEGERIDFTAVGNGVNFAKRLEGACEIHCVLFSSTTKDLAPSLQFKSEGLKKKLINIKHYTNVVETYEYDPFCNNPEARVRALEAYRQCASLARMEQRHSLSDPTAIVVNSSVGGGSLINFSLTGVSLKLKAMMVKGSTVVVHLDSVDGSLSQELLKARIPELVGEVRWVYSDTDGHVHGILFRDVSEKDATKLVEILKAFNHSNRVTQFGEKSA